MRRLLLEVLSILVKAVLAGIMIGIGGTVYLSATPPALGAFLFTLGLFTILAYGLSLYTGNVGYIVTAQDKIRHARNLVVIWFGNFIGCGLCAEIVRRAKPQLAAKAAEIASLKLSQPGLTVFVLSILCGLLMFIAVDNYKTSQDVGKYIGLFLCVPVFILSGFEHSIANMFTLCMVKGLAGLPLSAFFFILICTAGNAVGGVLLPLSRLIKEA